MQNLLFCGLKRTKLCEVIQYLYKHASTITLCNQNKNFVIIAFQQVINLIAPHLLPAEDGEMPMTASRDTEDEFPISALDTNVFRSRSRAFRKAEESN